MPNTPNAAKLPETPGFLLNITVELALAAWDLGIWHLEYLEFGIFGIGTLLLFAKTLAGRGPIARFPSSFFRTFTQAGNALSLGTMHD